MFGRKLAVPRANHDRTAFSTFDRVAGDLARQAFTSMGAAMRSRSDRIVKRWHGLSIKAMPHLDALTGAEFESSIALFFQPSPTPCNPRILAA